jgi:hypothetical protein
MVETRPKLLFPEKLKTVCMGVMITPNQEFEMRVEIKDNSVTCFRQDGDPKFYGVMNAAGESKFLHFLKKHLNKMLDNREFDIHSTTQPVYKLHCNQPLFIKKRMWKDGHLVDDMQQYLRSAKPFLDYESQITGVYAIYNRHWAIDGIEKDWNSGKAVLGFEFMPTESGEQNGKRRV